MDEVLRRVSSFPRLRYMGSKYRLVPHLAELFAELGGSTALDAFSGSGVVSYTLKCLGYEVTSNDFLAFPGVIASAAVANQRTKLSDAEVARIVGPVAGWSRLHPDDLRRPVLHSSGPGVPGLCVVARRRASGCQALSGHLRPCARRRTEAAAGVFTFTELRYDDGRRDLRLPLREHFIETVSEYNSVVFDAARSAGPFSPMCSTSTRRSISCTSILRTRRPRDDNCYIKRYHFLEGLSVYWRNQEIMHGTKTKKLAKRYTPFSYKHTITDALRDLFKRFSESTIVLSYSSNAVPDAATIEALLRDFKDDVEVRTIDHRYHFGTHSTAQRRKAVEYLFIGR